MYVHCFVGGEGNLKKWVINFPQVVFGLGMLGVREGLGRWVAGRPDRVDAPYLAQRGEAHVHSPFMVREWVLWLCKLWNLPLRVVTEIVQGNFQTLYQVGG